MCGIHAAISVDANYHTLSPGLEQRLRNRGPDHLGAVKTQLCRDDASSLYLTLTSTVLSLRGDHVARQPLVDEESGSVLCWNGEAWKLGGKPVEGNDGEAILSMLIAASSNNSGDKDSILDALRSIEGPFAFIFLDKKAKRLYYGRDRLGRRSLLLKREEDFLLSSIAEAPAVGWAEVEADGCYIIELSETGLPKDMMPVRHDWDQTEALVNVPYEETSAHRAELIDLIYPHNTEMDLSIACALYFAARGKGMGQLAAGSEAEPYSTTARVLLSGLGADELFGGYVRHATAFTRGGYTGLIDELKLDVSRLGKRNLGRDDRVMSHWSREVRFPYLDESLVKWAIELPAWEKCDFDNHGSSCDFDPEKRVLRLLANSLGMRSVAAEKKRAIQFGARTAKMESGKVKGTTLLLP
ncbi:asparagine synthetase domain-containing protein C4F6.11c [Trichoderma asperellum]|uniref:Asparagine synthetase domain-containing protein C4F6.11c n=1 Tax=Trichoderma asperellum TaxID=101201 RepID=A0A6V8QZR5_TRIAP|nr:asparagine synthetase domain-containing protein C4F6.11c [Trichoderma asperellum]